MTLTLETIVASPHLPTPPAVAIRLIETTRDPDHGLIDVVKVIKSDPALSAKILRAANSSYYALRTHAATVDHAAALLGTTAVTALALSFSLVRDTSAEGETKRRHLNQFWAESLLQAVVCELAGGHNSRADAGELFLAGLLVDLGQLALIHAAPRTYLAFLESTDTGFLNRCAIEHEHLGLDHVELGCALAANWMLPESLQEAIQFHHQPVEAVEATKDQPNFQVIRSVSLASRIAHYFSTQDKHTALAELKHYAKATCRMDADEIQEFLCEVRTRVDEAGAVLRVDTQSLADPAQLLAQANEQLVQLTIQYRQETMVHQSALEEKTRSLETHNQELLRRAEWDSLTALFNRSALERRLQIEFEQARKNGTNLGVLFCDLDKFKDLNDTYGHVFGDRVLAEIARSLERSVRSGDIVARYGGEEFVVIITNTTRRVVDRVAKRLVQNVANLKIEADGRRVPVTVSVGSLFTTAPELDAVVPQQLVITADYAMYRAKRAGGNQVQWARLGEAPLARQAVNPTNPPAANTVSAG